MKIDAVKVLTNLAPKGMIEALVDAACDREEDVRSAISKSLVEIGRKKHVTVLKICHTYLMKHNKVSNNCSPIH